MNSPNNPNNSQQAPEWKTIGFWVALLGCIAAWIPLILKDSSFTKEPPSPNVEIVLKAKCTQRGKLGLCID